MIILHGESITKSRDRLASHIDSFRKSGYEITRLDAKQLNLSKLESAIGSSSLFGTPQVLILEYLHSLPRSKQKSDLISRIAELAAAHPDTQIVLYEKRSLTPTMLKSFSGAAVEEFAATKHLFKWLETLEAGLGNSPTQANRSLELLHSALEQDGEFLCLAMMARQIRMLIEAKETGTVKGPPFMVAKLKKQASGFTLERLLQLHASLLELDLVHKNTTHRSLKQDLDLWVLAL